MSHHRFVRTRRAAAFPILCATALAQGEPPGAGDLAAAVRDRPVAEAWSSLAALRAVAAAEDRTTPDLEAAAETLGALVAAPGPADRRCLAALCLGALGPHAAESAEPLAALLAEPEPTEAQLGAAIALAGLGKPAVEPLGHLLALEKSKASVTVAGKKIKGQELANAGQLAAVLAMFAVVELGAEAKPLAKLLVEHVANLPDFDSYLIHQPCVRALEASGKSKSARKQIEARAEFEATSGGRGGMVPPSASMFRKVLEVEGGISFDGCSLPDAMPNLKERGRLGAAVLDLYDHLTAELVRLRADLGAEPGLDHAAWRKRTEGLVALAGVLQVLGGPKKAPVKK